MEAAAAAARKEWRAVSDPSVRSNGSEDAAEHGKMAQSDERAIYEEGAGGLEVDFCSITIDGSGGLSEDILQQRLQSVVRQREELQQVEIELRAQAIAHPQILEAQRSFEAAAKEHAAAAGKLKDQLQEREKYIIELEMKMNEKDRQLDALKIDHQTAWANQDLLREQTKELATVRRERDSSEAERAQHLKQIHDLQEHLREKESQFLALEEQHRVAQENILYKDEQLREAHSWVTRVQMDSLQSQSVQAELRERTEQLHQFWTQQYAEMQRNLLHTIQQLQLELTEARARTGTNKDSSQVAQKSSAESSFVQSKGNNMTANNSATLDGDEALQSNGNVDGSTKGEHASAVSVIPSSLLGIGGFLPSGQMTGMHPYMMHPQGIPLTSPNSAVPQFGHFQPLSAIQPNQHWPNQQEAPDASQTPDHTNCQPTQSDQSALQTDANYNDELSAKQSQVIHADHLIAQGKQQQSSNNAITESSHEPKAAESNITEYLAQKEQQSAPKEQRILTSNVNSSAVQFEQQEQRTGPKDDKLAAGSQLKDQAAVQHQKTSNLAASATQGHFKSSSPEFKSNALNHTDALRSTGSGSGSLVPSIQKEPALLDERSLLACIVRSVPAGPDGRIRISTTLPNRLGKMLAPLHWHDYKKHYGKLDDFVANHPELFVIEGDFIHLREGAQQIISATTAAAKIAAATASSAPHSSFLPSVAVTPVAQSIRQKRVPVVDSRSANTMSFGNGSSTTNFVDQFNRHSQIPKANDQQQSIGFNIIQGVGDVTVSSKLKNLQEPNGFSAEVGPGQSSIHATVANGGRYERIGLPTQDKGASNGRHGYGGKQQARSTGTAYVSRR